MRYVLLVSMLLSTLCASAQSKWYMDKDSVAHGPANEVIEWAAYRATVNEQNRTKTKLYWLVSKELQLCEKEGVAKDSALIAKDTLIEWQGDRILFLSDRVRKLEDRKPMRLAWFGAGVVAGWFTKQETQD
mgnify:CR=1 FL=1